jgi:hypothetical protein
MNPIENSKQNRLLLLESFIASEGLSERFLDFENSINAQYLTGNGSSKPDYSVALVDKSLLTMYFETKELIDWSGLSGVIGGLSDLASEYMFTYKSNKQGDLQAMAVQVDHIRDTTQMVLRLIKCVTTLNHYINNVEKFKDTVSGHLFSKYPDVSRQSNEPY